MLNEKTKILLAKYCSNELTDLEAQELGRWVNKGSNKAIFQKYIALNLSTTEAIAIEERLKNESWYYIESRIKKRSYKANFWKYGVAASIAVIMGLFYFLNRESNNTTINRDTVNTKIERGTNKATLTLDNGSNVILEKGISYQSDNVTSNGEEIVYENNPSKELVYNYLTIPRGGEFVLELEDNTKVWLNSETKLKYPTSFIDGQPRVVELVYGEAYFDVSPSSNHNGDSFRVVSNTQEIEVLGTEFNVKAYHDEDKVYTTLVEGSVMVSPPDKNQESGFKGYRLSPGQQYVYSKNDQGIEIKEVWTEIYTAWINGRFAFDNEELESILNQLGRWYNLDIEYESDEIKSNRYTGDLPRYDDFSVIIDLLSNAYNKIDFKIYEAERKIVVSKK